MINGNEEIRGIIADFKKLATKIQQDNGQIKKMLKDREAMLKDREVVLDACKKEYQKLYYEHKALKKKYIKLEQKLQQQPKQQKTTNVRNFATSKIDRFKIPRKCYYIVDNNEQDEAESNQEVEDEITENESDGENDVEYVKVQKKKKKRAVVEPPKKKIVKEKKKKTQKGIIDFINNYNACKILY